MSGEFVEPRNFTTSRKAFLAQQCISMQILRTTKVLGEWGIFATGIDFPRYSRLSGPARWQSSDTLKGVNDVEVFWFTPLYTLKSQVAVSSNSSYRAVKSHPHAVVFFSNWNWILFSLVLVAFNWAFDSKLPASNICFASYLKHTIILYILRIHRFEISFSQSTKGEFVTTQDSLYLGFISQGSYFFHIVFFLTYVKTPLH